MSKYDFDLKNTRMYMCGRLNKKQPVFIILPIKEAYPKFKQFYYLIPNKCEDTELVSW